MSKRAVGFVGLGKMGDHMTRRILSAGHNLTIFDTTKAAVAPLVAAGRRSGRWRACACWMRLRPASADANRANIPL